MWTRLTHFASQKKKAVAHFLPLQKRQWLIFFSKKKAVAHFASSVNFFHNDLEVMMSRSKGIKF
jgi:hypothetical protein